MSEHTVSHASDIFFGPALNAGRGKRGVPMTPGLIQINLGAPVATDADGVAASQSPSAGGALTLAASPVALDAPRNVTVTSAANEAARTFTVSGADEYGAAMSEAITGANAAAAAGTKAFSRVDSVTVDAATAGAVTVGWANVLGLPYRVGGAFDVLAFYTDGTEGLSGATLVAGDDTSPATTTTDDVRGTIKPGTAPNGTRVYRAWVKIHDASSSEGAYGVAQA